VLDAKRGTPIRAVLLQTVLTIALIFLGGGFRSLVRIAVVALWVFYFLTVRAVLRPHGKVIRIDVELALRFRQS
jgi:amino acid transporter